MHCHECGTILHKGAKFCTKCGAPVLNITARKPQEKSPATNEENATLDDNLVGKPFEVTPMAIIAIIVVGGLLIWGASTSFANDSSKNSATTAPNSTSSVITTLYTNATADVRACAASTCTVIGTYPPNINIDITEAANGIITNISQLPDWIAFAYSASNGSSETGYINSSLLSEQQTQSTSAPTPQPVPVAATPKKDLQSIIKQWSPSVALILCTYSDGSADFGSGFLTQFKDGSIVVVTNKHVITEETTGDAATSCSLEIPGDGDNTYTVAGTATDISSDGFDWGSIPVTDGDIYFNDVAENGLPLCQQQAQTGDNVLVLGYPDYAGQFTEPTATQGIISGYADPYYTTSAEIESGNSGGVAIDTQNDCYVGIPSAVVKGNYGNLGRILSAGAAFKLSYSPTPSNNQICQGHYGADSDWGGTLNSQGGPVCDCASGYTWNSGNTECVAETGYQICSNKYSNSTWDGTYASNGNYNCACDSGYTWSTSQNECVLSSSNSSSNSNNSSDYDETTAENYYITNHTCVGLSGNQYGDCLNYAYNH